MSELISIPYSSSAHWYTEHGRPMYQVPVKSKPGKMRNTTLTDARKLGLVPSVTTVMRLLAKPALERWNLRMHLEEALTNPTGDPDDVIRRVREAKAEAPDLGSLYHAQIEDALCEESGRTPRHSARDNVVPDAVLEQILSFINDAGIIEMNFEVPFASVRGFGGKIDFAGHLNRPPYHYVVGDWKTSGKPGDELRAWPEHCRQLSAYAHGIGFPDALLVNVLISTVEPVIKVHWWEPDEAEKQWAIFKHTLEIWKLEKNYDPRLGDRK